MQTGIGFELLELEDCIKERVLKYINVAPGDLTVRINAYENKVYSAVVFHRDGKTDLTFNPTGGLKNVQDKENTKSK